MYADGNGKLEKGNLLLSRVVWNTVFMLALVYCVLQAYQSNALGDSRTWALYRTASVEHPRVGVNTDLGVISGGLIYGILW